MNADTRTYRKCVMPLLNFSSQGTDKVKMSVPLNSMCFYSGRYKLTLGLDLTSNLLSKIKLSLSPGKEKRKLTVP